MLKDARIRQTDAVPGRSTALRYYDSISREWSGRYKEATPAGHALRVRKEHVLRLLDRPGRILDAGCGSGVMVSDLVRRGWDFWGIDASEAMIGVCRQRFHLLEQVHFSVSDIGSLQFPSEFFDAVICMGVIDRVPDVRRALGEMLRVLRPNGSAIVVFPNLLGPWAAWRGRVYYPALGMISSLLHWVRRTPRPASLLTEVPHLFTAGRVRRMFRALGGEVTGTVHYNFNLLLSPVDEMFPYQAMRSAEVLERLSGSPLRWLGGGFIVKVRKTGTAQP